MDIGLGVGIGFQRFGMAILPISYGVGFGPDGRAGHGFGVRAGLAVGPRFTIPAFRRLPSLSFGMTLGPSLAFGKWTNFDPPIVIRAAKPRDSASASPAPRGLDMGDISKCPVAHKPAATAAPTAAASPPAAPPKATAPAAAAGDGVSRNPACESCKPTTKPIPPPSRRPDS